jgi:hypothetical protein
MELKFRQGIVRHQIDVAGTANFVRPSGNGGNFIDLICDNAPLQFSAAHANTNYLIEFTQTIPNAWGPLTAVGETQFLYWDISLLDANVTFGFTKVVPYNSSTPPTTPILDQHWFDMSTGMMKVWNGTKWVIKVRVFAATYDNNAILVPRHIGSQVNLNVLCKAGNILKGKNNAPLRDGDGTFVTSESDLVVSHTSGENVRFDSAQLYAEATEFIPAFYAVSYIAPRKVQLASFMHIDLEVNGIMTKEYFTGEVGNVISHGLVRNANWTFADNQVNKPIFVGLNGELTLVAPPTGVTQEIGYVYDNDAIYVNIMLPIIM